MATCRGCIHWEKCSRPNGITRYCGKNVAHGAVEECCEWFISTSDVVPKSEVDKLYEVIFKKEDLMQKIAEERNDYADKIEFLRKTITKNAQKSLEVTLEEIEKAKDRVAREIFEEIEMFLNKAIDGWRKERTVHYHNRDIEMIDFRNDAFKYCLYEISELKKKYTEENND